RRKTPLNLPQGGDFVSQRIASLLHCRLSAFFMLFYFAKIYISFFTFFTSAEKNKYLPHFYFFTAEFPKNAPSSQSFFASSA
ncbi:MAG TPA: hypothetical protein PK495_03980, partial [Bacteroidales bacterium]|nr:hypothetical protein [Bacteroidales bacterium]